MNVYLHVLWLFLSVSAFFFPGTCEAQSTHEYTVVIVTGTEPEAQTDAHVSVKLVGENGNCTADPLPWTLHDQEAGYADRYTLTCEDIGPISLFEIWHDNFEISSDDISLSSASGEWEFKEARVLDPVRNVTLTVTCNCWLDHLESANLFQSLAVFDYVPLCDSSVLRVRLDRDLNATYWTDQDYALHLGSGLAEVNGRDKVNGETAFGVLPEDLNAYILLDEPVDVSSGWTLMFWAKHPRPYQDFTVLMSDQSGNIHVGVRYNNFVNHISDSQPFLSVEDGVSSVATNLTYGWHHWAIVSDVEYYRTHLYFDGKIQGTSDQLVLTDVRYLMNRDSRDYPFAGSWDDVRLYTCEMNVTEIGSIYNETRIVPLASNCSNGVQDGDETDIDCGGLSCEPCDVGLSCWHDYDCDSGVCGADGLCGDYICNPAGGVLAYYGDGMCTIFNNNEVCGYDYGDCCYSTCSVHASFECGADGFHCRSNDPTACESGCGVSYDCLFGGTCLEDGSCSCPFGRSGYDCSDGEGTCGVDYECVYGNCTADLLSCECLPGHWGTLCEFGAGICDVDYFCGNGTCLEDGNCLCPPGTGGYDCSLTFELLGLRKESPALSCTHIYELAQQNYQNATNGLYFIDPDQIADPFETYCDLDNGGWSLIMKLAQQSKVFAYDSEYWTNDETYQQFDPEFNVIEAKLRGYTRLPLNEVRLGILEDGSDLSSLNWLEMSISDTSSLHSLVSTDVYYPSAIGSSSWTSLFDDGRLQVGCFTEGINVDLGLRARIGIVADDDDDCSSPESYLGVGLVDRSAGNVARKEIYASEVNLYASSFIFVRESRRELFTWHQVPIPLPQPVNCIQDTTPQTTQTSSRWPRVREGMALFVLHGGIYMFGGGKSSSRDIGPTYNDLWRFDLHDREWEEIPRLDYWPEPRSYAGAARVADGYFMLTGGYSLGANYTDTWIYDIDSGNFSDVTELVNGTSPYTRGSSLVPQRGGTILVITEMNEVYEFSMTNLTWTHLESLGDSKPEPSRHQAVTSFVDTSGRSGALIYGGRRLVNGQELMWHHEVWHFVRDAQEWTLLTSNTCGAMPGNAQHRLEVASLRSFILSGRMFVYLQNKPTDMLGDEFWVFNPSTRRWAEVETPDGVTPSVRSSAGMVAVGGQGWVFGGSDPDGAMKHDLWVFEGDYRVSPLYIKKDIVKPNSARVMVQVRNYDPDNYRTFIMSLGDFDDMEEFNSTSELLSSAPSWSTLSLTNSDIEPDGTVDVYLDLFSEGLQQQEYSTTLNFIITNTNDAPLDFVHIPIQINVLVPLVRVEPTQLSVTLTKPDVKQENIILLNDGTADLTYEMMYSESGATWWSIEESERVGSVPVGGQVFIAIHFDSTDLQPALYTDVITIVTNDPQEPLSSHGEVSFPVSLYVTAVADPDTSSLYCSAFVTTCTTIEDGVAGAVMEFKVQTRDYDGYNCNEDSVEIVASILDYNTNATLKTGIVDYSSNGMYEIEMKYTVAGLFRISVDFRDGDSVVSLWGSPFDYVIAPATPDPAVSEVANGDTQEICSAGDVCAAAVVGFQAPLMLISKDAYGNQWEVQHQETVVTVNVMLDGEVVSSFTAAALGDGSYDLSFSLTSTGEYDVSVRMNNFDVSVGSDVVAYFEPSSPSATTSLLYWWIPANRWEACSSPSAGSAAVCISTTSTSESQSLAVLLEDAYGNSITEEGSQVVDYTLTASFDASITESGAAAWSEDYLAFLVEVRPTVTGNHILDVFLNAQRLANIPVLIAVEPGAAVSVSCEIRESEDGTTSTLLLPNATRICIDAPADLQSLLPSAEPIAIECVLSDEYGNSLSPEPGQLQASVAVSDPWESEPHFYDLEEDVSESDEVEYYYGSWQLHQAGEQVVQIVVGGDDDLYWSSGYDIVGLCLSGSLQDLCKDSYPCDFTTGFSRLCSSCPDNANCTYEGGGLTIQGVSAYPDYWRETRNSSVFAECLNTNKRSCSDFREGTLQSAAFDQYDTCKACMGGAASECYPGYDSRLCSVCSQGYSRAGNFECFECPSKLGSKLTIVLAVFLVAIIVLFMVKVTLSCHRANRNPKFAMEYAMLVKVFISYLQVMGFLGQVNLGWPSYVQDQLRNQLSVSTVNMEFLGVDCLLHKEGQPVLFDRIRLTMYIPVIILAGAIVIFFGYYVYELRVKEKLHPQATYNLYAQVSQGRDIPFHKQKQKDVMEVVESMNIRREKQIMDLAKSRFTTTMIVVVFFLYPTITMELFQLFACKTVDGTNYMLYSMDKECYGEDHRNELMSVGLPCLIFYVVGIPLVMFWILHQNRQKLDNKEVQMMLGFLFLGFEDEYYYWECWVTIRKMLVSFIIVVLSLLGEEVQGIGILGILFLSCVMHMKYQPYESDDLDYVEGVALLSTFTIAYFGTLIAAGDGEKLDDSSKDALGAFCFIINTVMMIYFTYKFLRTVLVSIFDENGTGNFTNSELYARVKLKLREYFQFKKETRRAKRRDPQVTASEELAKEFEMAKDFELKVMEEAKQEVATSMTHMSPTRGPAHRQNNVPGANMASLAAAGSMSGPLPEGGLPDAGTPLRQSSTRRLASKPSGKQVAMKSVAEEELAELEKQLQESQIEGWEVKQRCFFAMIHSHKLLCMINGNKWCRLVAADCFQEALSKPSSEWELFIMSKCDQETAHARKDEEDYNKKHGVKTPLEELPNHREFSVEAYFQNQQTVNAFAQILNPKQADWTPESLIARLKTMANELDLLRSAKGKKSSTKKMSIKPGADGGDSADTAHAASNEKGGSSSSGLKGPSRSALVKRVSSTASSLRGNSTPKSAKREEKPEE
eukprot:Rmarinus@m.14180